MNLRKASKFGLYAVVTMASRPGELVSAGTIAQRFDVSENHMAKVLQQLARARLVRSVRGVGGGYELAKGSADITMADVVEAIEGPLASSSCADCPFRQESPDCMEQALACHVHHVLAELSTQAVYTLRSVTIDTLARQGPLVAAI
jgi:Rrf2 family protein